MLFIIALSLWQQIIFPISMVIATTFALLPRGSLFPIGVIHDALYQNKVKWFHAGYDKGKLIKGIEIKVVVDRAWSDKLYRELIIDYGGVRLNNPQVSFVSICY